MENKLHTFGFTATKAAADFSAALVRRVHAAVDAGLVAQATPASAFAPAAKRGM